MTDRELIGLAAKAAGIIGNWERRPDHIQERWYFNVPYNNQGMLTGFEWNPLTDDGDALRLAVKLGFCVIQEIVGKPIVSVVGNLGTFNQLTAYRTAWEPLNDDAYAATRRAIVRAAAEIGEGLAQ